MFLYSCVPYAYLQLLSFEYANSTHMDAKVNMTGEAHGSFDEVIHCRDT